MPFKVFCFPVAVVSWESVDGLKQRLACAQFLLDTHPLLYHEGVTLLLCHFVLLIYLIQA